MTEYKLFWQHRNGMVHGTLGSPTSFDAAIAAVDNFNRAHPKIEHWVSDASLDFNQAQKMKLYPQSQESEPDSKLEEMVKRSIEIGRDIEKQAQEMDKSLVTDLPQRSQVPRV